MSSPFFSVARALHERGYSVLPIRPGFKIPGEYSNGFWRGMDGWQRFGEQQCSEDDVERWEAWPKAGICVCTGPASRVVAIDFDTNPELWARLEEIIPKSPVVKRGEKGYTAFYQYSGELSRNWRGPDGRSNIVELLSLGRQTVIPPTIHPKTLKPYVWDFLGLPDVSPDELPTLPADLAERFDEALGVVRKVRHEPVSTGAEKRSLAMITRALEFISPDVTYTDWRDVGMGIHSEHPCEDGLRVWEEWSAKGEKYKAGEPAKKWRGFKPDGGVTVATVFEHARRGGFDEWHFDDDRAIEGVSAELLPSGPVVPTPTTYAESNPMSLPAELMSSAPGFVGELSRWILSTAIKPQPALALGAALAAVGALKGHRVRTETNLRTNLYVLGLAGSGSGKNHPLNCLRMLFAAAGLSQLLGGEPASEPGLIQAISEGRGRSVILWDEMGHAVSAMVNPNAGTHLTTILSTLTKLFSEASTLHQGKVLAAGARTSVEQPCLCVFGVTVPGRFFETLTNEHAIDGFLARWLVFEVDTNRPTIQPHATLLDVPTRLIAAVRAIEAMPFRPEPQPGEITQDIIEPRAVPFTDQARRAFWNAQQYFDDLAEQAERRGEPTAPVWVRTAEHAAKIALTVTDGPQIGIDELSWALDLAEHQSNALCLSILHRIGKNSTERNVKEVLRVIRKAGPRGITRTQLYRETMWLSTNERNGVLTTLLDSDQIGAVSEERKGKGVRAVTYVAL